MNEPTPMKLRFSDVKGFEKILNHVHYFLWPRGYSVSLACFILSFVILRKFLS